MTSERAMKATSTTSLANPALVIVRASARAIDGARQAAVKVPRLAAMAGGLGLCLAISACASETTTPSTTTTAEPAVAEPAIEGDQPSMASAPVARALGCDRIDSIRIAGMEESLECFRKGRYLGRIHRLTPAATAAMADDANAFSYRYPEPEELTGNSPCKGFSPGVVVGDGWVVVVPTEPDAPRVAEQTGGRIVPPLEPGPIVSYPPPICQEG